MRVAIAVPSHDVVPFLFTYDLSRLCLWTASQLPEGVSFGLYGVSGTYVHKARQELIDHLKDEADYVLWLDSDMRFPQEALVGLIQRQVDMVGINYAKRRIPSDYVAIKRIGLGSEAPEKCVTNDESTGLEEVDAVGFGCVLIKTAALKDMPDPAEVPWFQNKHLGGTRWMGEDVHFCELFRESGRKIHVDHDLSKACSHIGQFEYRINHVAPPLVEV